MSYRTGISWVILLLSAAICPRPLAGGVTELSRREGQQLEARDSSIMTLATTSLRRSSNSRAFGTQKNELQTIRNQARLSQNPSPRLDDSVVFSHFEENHGQADARALFIARGRNATVLLTTTEVVITIRTNQTRARSRKTDQVANPRGIGRKRSIDTVQQLDVSKPAVVRMKFLNSSLSPRIVALDRSDTQVNYLISKDPTAWIKHVRCYRLIRYESVYPGIDLIFYFSRGQLEYDFIVSPQADPQVIRLEFTGVERVFVDDKKDLVLDTPLGQIRHLQPKVFQSVDGINRPIAGGYAIGQKNEVSFRLGAYDKRKPLFIDPILAYSAYLGGAAAEQSYAIAVDSSGNAYLTGTTDSIDFPLQDPLQSEFAGGGFTGGPIAGDVFVSKMSADGSHLIFSTYLGGTGTDEGTGIALDSRGNILVAGFTNSTDFPILNALQNIYAGGREDIFIAKLTPDGSRLDFSTFLGGTGADGAYSVSTDAIGDIYVTGYTISPDFPTRHALLNSYSGGIRDGFVSKLSSDGAILIYSTYLGGNGTDNGLSIKADASGSAFVMGTTSSTNFPTRNAVQPVYGGGGDAFVAKLDPGGSQLIYSTYLGGSSDEGGMGIVAGGAIEIDGLGNAYIVGSTISTDFPTLNPIQARLSGDADAFFVMLDSSGYHQVFSTYFGGTKRDYGIALDVDASSNVYLAGRTESNDLLTVDGIQNTNRGGSDAFVAKLDPFGSRLLFSTYLGGSADDEGNSIALDRISGIFIAGSTSSTDFPIVGSYPGRPAGRFDAFVLRIQDVLRVSIDIKPGSFPNTINLGAGGTVPVAILSTVGFEARDVDPVTITLSGGSVKLRGQGTPMTSVGDFNSDGILDLLVHITTEALELSANDTEAVLDGKTYDKKPIRGKDSVRIVP